MDMEQSEARKEGIRCNFQSDGERGDMDLHDLVLLDRRIPTSLTGLKQKGRKCSSKVNAVACGSLNIRAMIARGPNPDLRLLPTLRGSYSVRFFSSQSRPGFLLFTLP